MKINFLLIVTFTLGLCFSSNVFANIEFVIDVHQIKEKHGSNEVPYKEKIDYEISVDIGESYFSYTQNDTKNIYDFANKRIFTIDLTHKIFADDSLFSNIGFRTYEFQNRLILGKTLAAASVEDNPMLPVFSEHLFSLEQKDSTVELSRSSKDELFFFSAAGKELLSYSVQGNRVDSEDNKKFVKFLRYVFGGHPQILEQLSSENYIPKTILVHQYNVINESSKLTISQIKNTPNKLFTLEGYIPSVLTNDTDPFSKYLNAIKHSQNIKLESHLKLLLAKGKGYFKSRNYLDTILVYLEYGLTSSLSFPPVFQEQREVLVQDEKVKRLLTSLSPKSKEEAVEYLATLHDLEKYSKHQVHVIKIFMANIYAGLGDNKKAKDLFQEVLKSSPHIAGAYKDLGDLYFDDYNTISAWRCWDIAREIAPEHTMLTQISEFELSLMRDHPEFF